MTTTTIIYHIRLRPDSVDKLPLIIRFGIGAHAIPIDTPVGLTQARMMLAEWKKSGSGVPAGDVAALDNAVAEVTTARSINKAMEGAN